MDELPVYLYFNFRSPYCYLASKVLHTVFDEYHVTRVWRPLGGWDGRSPPERAKVKRPIARQDVARFARRLGIPINPPPSDTDPTKAAVGSLYAEQQGLLDTYITEVMRAEWAEARDIGDIDVLTDVADRIGLSTEGLRDAVHDMRLTEQLSRNWQEAQDKGALGVPTFVIGDQIFWGQDRIDFVREHLRELRLARL